MTQPYAGHRAVAAPWTSSACFAWYAPGTSPPAPTPAPPGGAQGGSGHAPEPPGGWGTALPPGVNPLAVGGGGPGPAGNDRTLPTVTLACGVASLPLAFCCSAVGLPLGVVAVVLGIVSLQRLPPGDPARGQAIGGMVCGALGVFGYLAFAAVLIAMGVGGAWAGSP